MRVEARAPVRIDFAGGWSDVPIFADERGGSVVNAAITRYVTVDVDGKEDGIELVAEDLGQKVTASNITQLEYNGTLDLHKAALRMMAVEGGIRIKSASSVPPGSGLGTSGALDVALVAALSEYRGEQMDRAELAETAFRLEAGELGLVGGRQDQYASALGGFLCLDFHADNVLVRRLEISNQFADELCDAMVLVYTGQTHFSSETHKRVWSGYRQGAPGVMAALLGLKEATLRATDALESENLGELACAIDANWSLQQKLHSSIKTPVTQAIETAARKAGATGAKATGAGAGGCMIFVGEPGTRPDISKAVQQAGATVLDYRFDMEGVRVS